MADIRRLPIWLALWWGGLSSEVQMWVPHSLWGECLHRRVSPVRPRERENLPTGESHRRVSPESLRRGKVERERAEGQAVDSAVQWAGLLVSRVQRIVWIIETIHRAAIKRSLKLWKENLIESLPGRAMLTACEAVERCYCAFSALRVVWHRRSGDRAAIGAYRSG